MLQKTLSVKNMLEKVESLILTQNYDKADHICHSIVQEDSDNLEAHFLLGTSAYHQQKWTAAADHYRRAIAVAPEIGFLHTNLALAYLEAGFYQKAQVTLDHSVRLDGVSKISHYHQGLLFQRTGRQSEALLEYESALVLDPKHVASRINLSAVLLDIGDTASAISQCRLGLEIAPDNCALTGNLATAYGKEFRFEESLAQYNRLLGLTAHTEQAEAMGRMANILCNAGRIDESITCFDRAITVSTDFWQKCALASTRLFVLHYSQRWTPGLIAQEHHEWGTTYFKPAKNFIFTNTLETTRRLRIAYISPDLRIHAVVFFLQPVLAAHNPEQVEIYCYSDVKKPDEVTRQLKEKHAIVWRDIADCDDDTVQRMILADRIDILVDLAGHSAGNRLSLFARRVAPIQVSWIGYPNTTGLCAMDYRLTDPKADPPGMTEQFHTEELIRLPDSFLCYRPGSDFPPESPLPMLMNRCVTFGSFSNFAKVTTTMLDLWAQILAAVPKSRLIFRARGMTDSRFKKEILPIFETHGVQPERIKILGHARSVTDNLRDYHNLDIALDTFPYHGTTTTCESLYMGVPVVTLSGRSHVSRVGVSLLQSIGTTDLIAENSKEYIAIAATLAGDVRRLLHLRKSLRSALLASPITDSVTFTRHLEEAYRMIWQRWCRKNNP